MKNLSRIIFLTMILFGGNCVAASKLESLDSIAKLLADNIDHGKNNCQLSVEESKTFINIVHAHIDTAVKSDRNSSRWDKYCQKGCHCEFYMQLIEDQLLTQKSKSLYERLKLNSKKTTAVSLQRCLKESVRLCNTDLFKSLKKEIQDFSPAPGM